MAERRGHPVAAAFVSLFTLALAVVGGFLAYIGLGSGIEDPGDAFGLAVGLVDLVGTVALLVVGGWLVWRLAQGHRRGAVGVVFTTLVVAAAAFWLLALAYGKEDLGCGALSDNPESCRSEAADWAVPSAVAAALLFFGLLLSRRVGTARQGRPPPPPLPPDEPPPPPA